MCASHPNHFSFAFYAGPAVRGCLLVIHTVVTHSRTVVHVMYYTDNVAMPTSRENHRMHTCSIAS